MRNTIIKALTICYAINFSVQAQQKNLADYVNTLQGTNSKFELTHGNTYPTTALPFGMHTWTPQTSPNGDGWKYQYEAKTIRGFQQAHQCSSWTNDYAVFSFFPTLDSLQVDENKRATRFQHNQETARPYYYQVKMANAINTEIAPTERGAHIRFTFPQKHKGFIVLDGYTGYSDVKIFPSERKITGYVNNGIGFKEGYKSFFVAYFDNPFEEYGTWDNTNNEVLKNNNASQGKGKGIYLAFKAGSKVQIKVASSYISADQAEKNVKEELGLDKSLETTKQHALDVWNKHLEKITIEDSNEENKRTFYSCFFRASLFPRKFYEIDHNGEAYYFSPYDGKIHKGYMFTDTGFWDTFRAQFPLNAILYPTMHGQYMHAILDAYQQCGWLPAWSFPSEAGSMIGNHAISLLADAWAKGIHTFDPKLALEAYLHEVTNKGPWGPANGREGWQDYYTLGYVPYDHTHEATAKTLEYAYDDFCGYQLAKMTKQPFYEEIFGRQIFNYKNVYNPNTGYMQGRNAKGEWRPNFDPNEWGGPFTEGNAWHWLWSVFHDPKGLIQLVGGEKKFTTKMDSVFSVPNTVNVGSYGGMIHEMKEMVDANMGQYAHGNQPIQHMIYLYNYAGEPWKAQYHVRNIMSKLYNSSENGYPGDEDQGQTSSWYVLSALGIYSVCPGTDQYVLGSPLFSKATIKLENGKQFIIDAKDNSTTNVYIQNATLNKNIYYKNYLTYQDIINGGKFILQMSKVPNMQRGITENAKPFSVSNYVTDMNL